MDKYVSIPSRRGLTGYFSTPEKTPKAGLLLIHEIWGLVEHIERVADRFAAQGYAVLAPNLLHDTDITKYAAGDFQEALFDPARHAQTGARLRQLMAPLAMPGLVSRIADDLTASFAYLSKRPGIQERVGIVGFCFGGTQAFSLAVREPRLGAAVAFYGQNPHSVEELAKIRCPVLAFYGEQDDRLVKDLPSLVEKMKAARVDFRYHIYPDCRHAFFNDANRFTYHELAASDAWQKTLAFLSETLTRGNISGLHE